MADVIVIAIVAVVAVLAVGYIVRAKRSGKTCIGCPNGGSCSGSCTGCDCEKRH